MNTLFDFITHVKGIEYLLAIGFIGLFILIWEALSAKPFKSLLASGREDLEFISHGGLPSAVRTAGHTAMAPFLFIAYTAAIPLAFIAGLGMAGKRMINRLARRR